MSFSLGKNSKLRELEDLDQKINALLADENRTTNTDSISRSFNERERKMCELMHIFFRRRANGDSVKPNYKILSDERVNFHRKCE